VALGRVYLSILGFYCHYHSFHFSKLIHDRRYTGCSLEEINILGGDIIGHCEKEVRINMCLILIGYQDRAV
jgi:hypothetical protein